MTVKTRSFFRLSNFFLDLVTVYSYLLECWCDDLGLILIVFSVG